MSVIYLDVDGTTLNLDNEWYARYNRDYDDNLTGERVTAWAVHEFVKPECGMKIYDYLLQEDLYENAMPTDGAKDAIDKLREAGHEVLFLSASIHRGKYLRLKELGFLHKEEEIFFGKDKSRFIGDYIVDDGWHNIESSKKNMLGILFDAPHNRSGKALDYKYRAFGWYHVRQWINYLENKDMMDAITRGTIGALESMERSAQQGGVWL